MKGLYKQLGENVRTARKEKKETQAVLAEVLGISPAHFSGMETGKKKFTVEQLATISLYLRVPMERFIGGLSGVEMEAGEGRRADMPRAKAVQEFDLITRKLPQEKLDAILEVCRIFVDSVAE